MASCLFLGDVFMRRVSVNFGWLPPLLARLARSGPPPPAAPASRSTSSGCKSRKAEVAGHLEQLRAATRFELPAAIAGRREIARRTGAAGILPNRAARAARWRPRRRKKRRIPSGC